MDKNENIESLYGQLNNDGTKSKVTKLIAKACGKKYMSVKNHWLTIGEVPEDYQDRVITILQNALFEQNKAISQTEVKDPETVK